MCIVLLPPGVDLIAVYRYIISYHIISYHIISTLRRPDDYTDEPSVDPFKYNKDLEESYDVSVSMNCHVMNVKIS